MKIKTNIRKKIKIKKFIVFTERILKKLKQHNIKKNLEKKRKLKNKKIVIK